MRPMQRKAQTGGTLTGVVVGLVLGLGVALGVALYVGNVPVPFVDKLPQRTADQGAEDGHEHDARIHQVGLGEAGHQGEGPPPGRGCLRHRRATGYAPAGPQSAGAPRP